MYYVFGLLFIAVVVVAVWLVRHPLALVAVNVVPIAWWWLGGAGVALTGVVLISMGAAARGLRSPPTL